MKNLQQRLPRAALALVFFAAVIASCKSAPPPPTQDDLNLLNAAIKRADTARQSAAAVQGNAFFPEDWSKAQADESNGRKAGKETAEAVKNATALYTSAANTYEDIAEKSGPLYAKALEDARVALAAERERAEKAQKDAEAVNGQGYFPDAWNDAVSVYQSGINSPTDNYAQIMTAVGNFTTATERFNGIADGSRPLLARDEAQKKLDAAIARAEASRNQAEAADGQANFPNEWKNADTKHTSAKTAKASDTDELLQVAALYTQAADAFDDIAKKSAQKTAKEMEDNQKALNAAIARLEKSRKEATDAKGQTNFPNDWKAAETKNAAAVGAKRATVAEIKAAIPLYGSAADAYDDIVRKVNAGSLDAAQAAKTRAEKERQTAMDAKANVAVAADFGAADKLFQQAVKDFGAKTYVPAADNYGKAATQFAAATVAAGKKRDQAKDAIEKAQQKSAQSAAYAVETGRKLEAQP